MTPRIDPTPIVERRQSKAIDARAAEVSTDVDDALALLRTAVHDTGWTLEALEAAMKIDKSLISRVLNGERPLTLKFLVALPDDVEARYEQLRAEAFGLIVVQPVTGADAIRHLVGGLVGLLASGLPARADHMAKATLQPAPEPAGA
jgi:hypothetical protein